MNINELVFCFSHNAIGNIQDSVFVFSLGFGHMLSRKNNSTEQFSFSLSQPEDLEKKKLFMITALPDTVPSRA